jgi:hypothetical protein
VAHITDQWKAAENTVISLQVPQDGENFFISLETTCFSQRKVFHGVSDGTAVKAK